jgi:hypothetical protein
VTVEIVGANPKRAELAQALDEIRRTPNPCPFWPGIVDFCQAFSKGLTNDREAALYPELKVLGFHLRRAAILELQRAFETLNSGDCILVPRGLVFHVPPANVDTIFIYSWLLAALTGNRNVIRLSSRESPQIAILLRLFAEAARTAAAEEVLATTLILRYGHDRDITAAISAEADVRVIWGGDRTVNEIRSVPLPPHAREVTFPDRYSMSAIEAEAYLETNDRERADIASRFFNDTYWFDQAGCSSPRLLIWIGTPEACAAASPPFVAALSERIAAREYHLPLGAYLKKLTFAYGAVAGGGIASYTEPANELSVLSLETMEDFTRDHPAGGLLFEWATASLEDLAPFVTRRDQTLTHFGFSTAELSDLTRAVNGRGLDRIVPIGEALDFNRYWDGCDLLQEMTRRVHVRGRTERHPRVTDACDTERPLQVAK